MAAKKSASTTSGRQGVKRRRDGPPPRRVLPVDDLARFPEENPNAVFRARADGTLIYTNPAGAALLESLGWRVDKKLPAAVRKQMTAASGVPFAEFDLAVADRVYSVAASSGAAGCDVNLYFRDVTSRKQAEESLHRLNAELERRVAEQTAAMRQSYEAMEIERQRLYDVLETLPVYVILLTPDYHVSFANRFFRERFGESNGQRCFEYLFHRTEPCDNCETFKVLKTGGPHHWEWTGPDSRDYDIYDFPFVDSDGRTLILEMGIDITEVHKARAALEEINRTLEERVAKRTARLVQTNRRLREEVEERRKVEAALVEVKEGWERTFNTVPDLIAILDSQHRIVRVNRAMAEALAVPPDECVGLSCFQCVHGTDGPPESCPHSRTLLDCREHTAEVHEDRLRGDFLVTTTPMFGPAGELIGSVHVARDITERKRSEAERDALAQQRQLALNAARMGWWHYDPATRNATWDERYAEIFRLSGRQGPGNEIAARLHPDDLQRTLAAVEAALDPADPKPYSVEYRVIHPDGTVRWAEAHGVATFEGQGAHRRAVSFDGTTADVTDRKQAEEAIRRSRDELEALVAERTAVAERRAEHLRRMAAELSQAEQNERKRLAATLHDDLQQLLLAARLRLAGVGRGDPAQHPAEVEAVDKLLDECMTVSRDLTMELSPPILHRGNLGEAIKWLGGWFGERHGLSVGVEARGKLLRVPEPVRVFLFHAVRELLSNVVKHSGIMEAQVILSSGNGCLTIDVEDRGSGFDLEAVRQKLERAQSFGLLNIRERLEALDGRMEFERTPTAGARFRLTVPALGEV